MTKKFKKTVFIFRRDLRLDDNHGLQQAINSSESVIPCFIFDPRQVSDNNSYKSDNAIQFMIESLIDLENQLSRHQGRLFIFKDMSHKTIEKLIKEEKIEAVFCNKDYTPFSRERDAQIQEVCKKNNIYFQHSYDALLNEPEAVRNKSGTPYAVFTPFYKHCFTAFAVPKPIELKNFSFYSPSISSQLNLKSMHPLVKSNSSLKVHGGSKQALSLIQAISGQREYLDKRDYPSLDATTHLSAHLKFGTISIRFLFHAIIKTLGINHPLLRQLYWRDFFYHVAYNNPRVFGSAYEEKYNAITWKNNQNHFDLWCQGKTGFPIVDAGMRELNTTGYMHNRVRMIVASFLTKDLHIDWRWGEKYFAQKLVDYDPAVNNGNWQWAASTGCDAQPYFRIFNPWLQQEKFDSECIYIKRWIPELKNTPIKAIHQWYKTGGLSLYDYPRPIVDHSTQSALAKELYKKC